MDKEVLKRQLTERCQQALDKALLAVESAPDGQWIAASEWTVREIFQKLTADCFGQMIQRRIDDSPSEARAAFSPGGPSGATARKGKSHGAGADGGR